MKRITECVIIAVAIAVLGGLLYFGVMAVREAAVRRHSVVENYNDEKTISGEIIRTDFAGGNRVAFHFRDGRSIILLVNSGLEYPGSTGLPITIHHIRGRFTGSE